MKLYTEEQVIKMIQKSRETGLSAEFLILTTPPIELPSNEEISEEVKFYDERWDIRQAIEFGAKLICDKIQENHIGDVNKMVGGEQ
jgi:hypothetical protein